MSFDDNKLNKRRVSADPSFIGHPSVLADYPKLPDELVERSIPGRVNLNKIEGLLKAHNLPYRVIWDRGAWHRIETTAQGMWLIERKGYNQFPSRQRLT